MKIILFLFKINLKIVNQNFQMMKNHKKFLQISKETQLIISHQFKTSHQPEIHSFKDHLLTKI